MDEPTSIAAVREFVQELLGPGMLTANPPSASLESAWSRGSVRGAWLGIYASREELARSHKCVTVCIAPALYEALVVIPGSQAEKLTSDEAAALSLAPPATLPGQVTLRLSAGDAVFLNPAILRRKEIGTAMQPGLNELDFYI